LPLVVLINRKDYLICRYMSFFPVPKNATARYLFEKSATYFDGDLVPRRAHALLPHAKLVSCNQVALIYL
jgi:hypothetical protein